MTSRTSLNSSGLTSPLRATVSVTEVPFLPRISLTASESGMPRVSVSSILMIRSPALMPARNAGVSSIGATTRTAPSSGATSMPSPPNSPCVLVCRSLKASALRKAECGSSPVSMPEMASWISLRSSTGST
jgi:hypothetical protein